MKAVKFVGHKSGENANTPADIVGVAGTYVYDSEATVMRCRNSGDNSLVTVREFEVVEKAIPDWMDADIFARSTKLQIDYKYFVGYGGNADCGEKEFSKLNELDGIAKFICIKLHAQKKFRSKFRSNLRAQLNDWIDGKSNHSKPFSHNQLDCLITEYDRRNYKAIGSAIYHQW